LGRKTRGRSHIPLVFYVGNGEKVGECNGGNGPRQTAAAALAPAVPGTVGQQGLMFIDCNRKKSRRLAKRCSGCKTLRFARRAPRATSGEKPD